MTLGTASRLLFRGDLVGTIIFGFCRPFRCSCFIPPPSHLSLSPFRYTMGLLGSRLTFLFLSVVSLVSASPTHYGWDSTIIHRVTYPVIRDAVDPSGSVMDGVNLGLASDGAGTGFDVPAILWISFGLAVGLYLTLGGMRLWRITTALAIGLVAAFCGKWVVAQWFRLLSQRPICSLGGDREHHELDGCVRFGSDSHHIELPPAWLARWSLRFQPSCGSYRVEYPQRDVCWGANRSVARGAALTHDCPELDCHHRACGGWVRGDAVQATDRHCACHSP